MASTETSPDQLFERLTRGDRAALGRAITLVESARPADRDQADALLARCLPLSGKSLRVGITGIPGVGKSTLIDALGMAFIAHRHRVAVLAVDPSSTRSGGSILGDKTRMERLSTQDAAFIRPSPSSGTLGGVAGRTHEIIVLCEAAGYDRILVETVGVGQSELAVDRMTDLFLLLMIAGTGDELQGIKRGIMEAADIIAINKADGGQEGRSERTRAELKRAVAMLPARPSGRRAEVVLCSALQESGIDELRALIEEFGEQDRRSGGLEERRSRQRTHWLQVAIDEALRAEFHNDPSVQEELERLGVAAREGQVSPFQAARRLIARFRKGGAPPP